MSKKRLAVSHIYSKKWFPIPNFPLYVGLHEIRNSTRGGHDHDADELTIITHGKCTLTANDSRFQVSIGDTFVSLRGDVHSFGEVNNCKAFVLLYDLKRLNIDMKDLPTLQGFQALFALEPVMRTRQQCAPQLRLDTTQLDTCRILIDSIMRELEQKDRGSRFIAAASFQQLLGYLTRCYSNVQSPEAGTLLRIAEALSFMEKNYECYMAVAEIAASAHVSERTLRREFNRALGISPSEYLRKLRVRKAEQLLTRSRLNITETALQCGFADSNYFSRAFRKVNGMSPREFRKLRARRARNFLT